MSDKYISYQDHKLGKPGIYDPSHKPDTPKPETGNKAEVDAFGEKTAAQIKAMVVEAGLKPAKSKAANIELLLGMDDVPDV